MSEPRSRSPKHPGINLKEAVGEMRQVFEIETRNKMSREVLASHLGYSGISGASATKIGALRHFGLIEGSGDELRVSTLAVTLLMKDENSKEYREALRTAVRNPVLYSELLEEYESKPSQANLEFNLVERGFLKKSAVNAAQDFLISADFARFWDTADAPTETTAHSGSAIERSDDANSDTDLNHIAKGVERGNTVIPMADGEEEVSSGRLSKSSKYRLLITGPFGVDELDLLIRKLELDREFLD